MIPTLVFCLAIMSLVLSEKIHERMTAEEVEEVFQTTPDAVPDYEVVQYELSTLVKRGTKSARMLKFRAFDGDVKLWLQPTDGILAGKNTPVYFAKQKGEEIIYQQANKHVMRKVGKLLEDPGMKASVIINEDSRGRRSINGHIASENLVIRSVPESLLDRSLETDSLENVTLPTSNIMTLADHIVFKTTVKPMDINETYRVSEPNTRVKRSQTEIPEVVYPEIMVVVDSILFKSNDKNVYKLLSYLVTFWNGVDLQYRGFEGPKFRFNIACIIIAKRRSVMPYISKNMITSNMFNVVGATRAAGHFYFKLLDKFTDNSYDAVIIMTGLNMKHSVGSSETPNAVPKIGGACEVDWNMKTIKKVAIIQDDGCFDGVSSAAHDFAHLLGSRHDNRDKCEPEEGYIMSTKSTRNSHHFSSCTVHDIQNWLSQGKGSCMYNVPKTTNQLPRVLPGRLRNRDSQCRMLDMGDSCYSESVHDYQCTAVYCKDPYYKYKCYVFDDIAPADGSSCGQGQICVHGRCVTLPSNNQ